MRWTRAFALFQLLVNFCLAAHGPLCAAQSGFVPPEAVERREVVAAVAHPGKAGNAHIDTDCAGDLRQRLVDIALGLEIAGDCARFDEIALLVHECDNRAENKGHVPVKNVDGPDYLLNVFQHWLEDRDLSELLAAEAANRS